MPKVTGNKNTTNWNQQWRTIPALWSSKVGDVWLALASGREVQELVPWTFQNCLWNKSCKALSGRTRQQNKKKKMRYGTKTRARYREVRLSYREQHFVKSSTGVSLSSFCWNAAAWAISSLLSRALKFLVLGAWESAKRCWHHTQEGYAMPHQWKDWYNPECCYKHLCTSLVARKETVAKDTWVWQIMQTQ